MSVLINMEMPKNGSCIQIIIDDDGKVYPSVEKCILKMGSIANAVPVPPHGDLVDKQRMAETNEQHYKIFEGEPEADYARKVVLRMLDQAPTVIPADDKDTDVPIKEEGET